MLLSNILSRAPVALISVFAVLAMPSAQARAAVHGDWAVACRADICIAESTVLAEDRSWLATVRARPVDDGAEVQFLVPVGVHIASGLFVSLPRGSVKQAQFVRCVETACEAHLKLSRREIGLWQRGLTTELRYRPRVKGRPLTFDVSLMGITAALREVESRR